jgi:hypothetical protein
MARELLRLAQEAGEREALFVEGAVGELGVSACWRVNQPRLRHLYPHAASRPAWILPDRLIQMII